MQGHTVDGGNLAPPPVSEDYRRLGWCELSSITRHFFWGAYRASIGVYKTHIRTCKNTKGFYSVFVRCVQELYRASNRCISVLYRQYTDSASDSIGALLGNLRDRDYFKQ